MNCRIRSIPAASLVGARSAVGKRASPTVDGNAIGWRELIQARAARRLPRAGPAGYPCPRRGRARPAGGSTHEEPMSGTPQDTLSPGETLRYARHLILPEVGPE